MFSSTKILIHLEYPQQTCLHGCHWGKTILMYFVSASSLFEWNTGHKTEVSHLASSPLHLQQVMKSFSQLAFMEHLICN